MKLVIGALAIVVSAIFLADLREPAAARPRFGHGGASFDLVSAQSVPQPQRPGDIVGFAVENGSSASLRDQPLTFGQVFQVGKLAAGTAINLTVNGQPVPGQLDVKSTYPDGSVKMGVVSAVIPALWAGGTVSGMIATAQAGSQPAQELGDLKGYNLTVDISVQGGGNYHLNAAQILAAALSAGKASYWLHGPVATEARVDAPVTASLHVTFDIRKYATGKVVTDIAFKNDYSMQKSGGTLNYDVAVREGDQTILQRSGISQLQYTTWHVLSDPAQMRDLNVIHDIASLERSGAILDYDLSDGVASNVIDRETQDLQGLGFDILQNAGLMLYMGATGGRDDIGPTTRANTIWLLTQDARVRAYALAQADAAGTIPWHFFNPAAGTYRTAIQSPKLWTDERAGREKLQPLTQLIQPYSKDCNCFSLDAAHQPDLSFVPFILTGSRYYLDQLEAETTWDVLGFNAEYRGFDRGVIVNLRTQLREEAWSLRNIMNAAWIVPDNDPLKRYFESLQTNNLASLYHYIAMAHQGEAYGWFPCELKPEFGGGIEPWQEDYLAFVMLLAVKRGVPGAADILKWQENFLTNRFLSEDKGFPPGLGVSYHLYTYAPPDPTTGAYQTWEQMAKATMAAEHQPDFQAHVGYVQEAKGVLAGLAHEMQSAQAAQAYDWLVENAPKVDARKDEMDPTWRLTPP